MFFSIFFKWKNASSLWIMLNKEECTLWLYKHLKQVKLTVVSQCIIKARDGIQADLEAAMRQEENQTGAE